MHSHHIVNSNKYKFIGDNRYNELKAAINIKSKETINSHEGFTAGDADGHTAALKVYAKDFTGYTTDYSHAKKNAQTERASAAPADFTFNVIIPQKDVEAVHGSSSPYNTFYIITVR